MATFDAVFVGSGINSLAGAALLAREGWCVCVLERNDRAGGCIRTSTTSPCPGSRTRSSRRGIPSSPGRRHTPSWVTSSTRRGVDLRQHRPPDRRGVPGRLGGLRHDGSLEGNVAEFERLARRATATAWERQFAAFMANADLAFGILGTELWSTAGLSLGQKALAAARPARAARVRRHDARQLPRLGHRDVPVGGRARRPRSVGPPHRPRARAGDVRLHDAGDRRRAPARRHAGAGRRRRRGSSMRSPGSSRDAGGEVRLEADVDRVLVAERPRDGRAPRRRRGRRRRRAPSSRA